MAGRRPGESPATPARSVNIVSGAAQSARRGPGSAILTREPAPALDQAPPPAASPAPIRPPPPRVDTPLLLSLVALAAAVGAAMNAVAGGGTLVTFPALVALGVPPVTANATSTVALWPGTMASMWGYRAELRGARHWARVWAVPSLVGGVIGALLLLRTPERRFEQIVPWLILGATALFMAQGPILRRLREAAPDHTVERADGTLAPPPAPYLFYQLLVGVYGGYFGAGAGILMLAALGLMGLTNIHQMNGLKNWGGGLMNLVAVLVFAASGIVNWPVALAMAVGATLGGIGGSLLAQRVGQQWVRRVIVAIGLGSGIAMLFGLI